MESVGLVEMGRIGGSEGVGGGGVGMAFIPKMTAITANIIMAGDEWRLIVIPSGRVNQTGGGRSANCVSFHGAQRAMLCCFVGALLRLGWNLSFHAPLCSVACCVYSLKARL